MRLLLVEDTATLARAVTEHFRSGGHVVDHADSVARALAFLAAEGVAYDVVLLDVNLPDGSGERVLASMRESREAVGAVPVLVLTARSEVADRVRFLDLGADDYITKPFHFDELDARCRAILRRQGGQPTSVLVLGDLTFDVARQRVEVDGEPVALRSRELRMLEVLAMAPDRLFSKHRLIEKLFDLEETPSDNAIEVYVGRLRRKLARSRVVIETVRGEGYRLVLPQEPDA